MNQNGIASEGTSAKSKKRYKIGSIRSIPIKSIHRSPEKLYTTPPLESDIIGFAKSMENGMYEPIDVYVTSDGECCIFDGDKRYLVAP